VNGVAGVVYQSGAPTSGSQCKLPLHLGHVSVRKCQLLVRDSIAKTLHLSL
jgi:hypothetical protein